MRHVKGVQALPIMVSTSGVLPGGNDWTNATAERSARERLIIGFAAEERSAGLVFALGRYFDGCTAAVPRPIDKERIGKMWRLEIN